MAENKKSFLAYCDWIETFEALPDEKAGQFVKHIFRYVKKLDTETDEILINSDFANIKQALKRDLRKYESICERNKINGAKGGRPKIEEPKKPSGLSGNPEEPKKPDTDNDTDNDIEIIYKLYPTKCPVKKSSTNKSKSDKEKIKKMLLNISKDDLIFTINTYISECKNSNTYIKNFKTFLNNLPDYEKPIKEEVLNDGIQRFTVLYDSDPKRYKHSEEEIINHCKVHNTRVRAKS